MSHLRRYSLIDTSFENDEESLKLADICNRNKGKNNKFIISLLNDFLLITTETNV